MADKFTKGGQEAWFHDQGHWGGFFHTYDSFQVAGSDEQPRKIHIFLPRDYEVSQECYPVIYMNDGDTAFFPGGAYDKTWNMAQVVTRLYLRNQIRKVIVVAICPLNRDYEYTHAPVWKHDWGGLSNYARYLAYSVKGFIDDNYRTITAADKTMILGSSHGGLAAFYTATQYPEQFRCVAALSPSFWVGLDSTIDVSLFKLFGPFCGSLKESELISTAYQTLQNTNQRLKIYLDWGLVREGGFHNAFIEERATARGREMRDLLVQDFGYQENENLFIVEDLIGQHTEESWSERMEKVLSIFLSI
ncbi:MAG: alpha/beta hydrolase [Symploca sp. SIO2G7]|nr:alpha/beta hydrolase [Symploca sp. SIO2G7]